jgi:hypothetical protein
VKEGELDGSLAGRALLTPEVKGGELDGLLPGRAVSAPQLEEDEHSISHKKRTMAGGIKEYWRKCRYLRRKGWELRPPNRSRQVPLASGMATGAKIYNVEDHVAEARKQFFYIARRAGYGQFGAGLPEIPGYGSPATTEKVANP